MKTCVLCGKELKDTACFCTYCGSPVESNTDNKSIGFIVESCINSVVSRVEEVSDKHDTADTVEDIIKPVTDTISSEYKTSVSPNNEGINTVPVKANSMGTEYGNRVNNGNRYYKDCTDIHAITHPSYPSVIFAAVASCGVNILIHLKSMQYLCEYLIGGI